MPYSLKSSFRVNLPAVDFASARSRTRRGVSTIEFALTRRLWAQTNRRIRVLIVWSCVFGPFCRQFGLVLVECTLKQIAQRDDFKSLPRSGRPPASTRQDRRTILRIVRSNPNITYAVRKLEASVKVHKSTLYRLLKEEGITNWLAKKRPLLTLEVIKKRL